jgi:hypothetical protein
MFLANVLARGIHPPENIQNGVHLGGGGQWRRQPFKSGGDFRAVKA